MINLMGTVYLESLDCPFRTADRILAEPDRPKITVVDFHAEATGEKRSMGFYLDGRVSSLFGTHTHVPKRPTKRFYPGAPAISLTRA